MFTIRDEQFAALRKKRIGDGLVRFFEGPGQAASRDPRTGDVLVADPKGHTLRCTFDEKGFVGGVVSPLGRTWKLENDRQGRLQGLTSPSGVRLGIRLDDRGAPTALSRGDRPLCDLGYDDLGRLDRIGFPDATATRIRYDGPDRLAAVTDRLGVTETFDYDPEGRVVALTDGNGNRTSFEYGDWDLPDRTLFADGTVESYEYDPAGLVRRIAAGSGLRARIDYDQGGRPVAIAAGDGEVSTFAYDDHGRLIEASNPTITVRYDYDDQGRVIREDQGGQAVDYHYDEAGLLVALTYPTGERVEFEFDADRRPTCVQDWDGGRHRFDHASGDRGLTLRSPNGLTTAIALTAVGLPASIVVSRPGPGPSERPVGPAGDLFAQRYRYDDEDRVQAIVSDRGTREYRYDAENRLLAVSDPGRGPVETFAYDAAGNRVRRDGEVAAFNELNQLVSQGATRCAYDDRGNAVAIVGPEGAWHLAYDGFDRLVRAEGRAGRDVTFGYDAFGRRVWKRAGGVEARFLWAGENLLREVSDAGHSRDYLYVPGTYAPLALRVDGVVYCCHTDHLGTPQRLTDAHGAIAWAADYDAFGAAAVRVAVVSNPLRLPGQYFDEETGLHYNRFRYYAPALGRYLTRDPARFLAGLNFYAYAGNDPINSADPIGLWPSFKSVAKAVGSAVVGVAAGVAVGAGVVALAATAPISLPVLAVTAAAVVAGGAAAGAVGFGLNEALNQEHFCLGCIAKAALKGAGIGAVAALPFAFLPASAPLAAFMGAGALSGAISYGLGTPPSQWTLGGLAGSVGLGAVTGGLGRFLGGRYGQWRQGRAVARSQAAEGRASSAARSVAGDKAVASDGKRTVSGYNDPPEGYTHVTPERVAAHSERIGHPPRAVGGPDQVNRGGFPGKFNASHAEKKLALARPNEPIGVSRPMCTDCQAFFRRHAQATGKQQIVSDPEFTRIFHPDGTVTEIPRY